MTCKCHKDYNKKPQESCLYCAEKHIATAMQAYNEQGYLNTNRQFIIGELELARKHLDNYEQIAERIRQFRHDIQNRQVQVNKEQWQVLCNMLNEQIENEEKMNKARVIATAKQEQGKIYIFSNVEALESNKIKTYATDILVFLNKAVTYPHYRHNLGIKMLYRRSDQASYGNKIHGVDNWVVFGDNHNIDKSFIEDLKKTYDWNYQIEQGKVKCMTTGYMVTEWMHHRYPNHEIYLVNFGYEVSQSTYRCPWHNWKFEAQALSKYKHIFTAKKANIEQGKPINLLINTSGYLGDNVVMTAVLHNLYDSGKFKVNIQTNHPDVYAGLPYLDNTINPDNADYIINQGYSQDWRQGCKHMIQAIIDRISYTVNIPIECKYLVPELKIDLGNQPLMKSDKPYVVFNNGFQNSAPTKKYFNPYWQGIIDQNEEYQFVQVGQSKNHAMPLKNTISFIDKTDFKALCNIIANASCIITPPSGIMHIAGAYNKPCIVLSGGRQPESLTKYPNAVYLSSIDQFECCKGKGCHRNKWETDDANKKCLHYTNKDNETTADCMLCIKPVTVSNLLTDLLNKKDQ